MALSAQQHQIAQLLYGLAVHRGLSPLHAREFVAAAFSESTLNPRADNPRTHAHGLFQLLSSGYRQRAQQLGGLDNPRANALAILPQYQRYWQQHPHAQAGAAGRDVERSGAGAGFYSKSLGLFSDLGGGPAAGPNLPPPAAPSMGQAAAPDRRQIGMALLQAVQPGPAHNDFSMVYDLVRQSHQTPMQQPGPPVPDRPVQGGTSPGAGGRAAINELFYDPLGGIKHGQSVGAIGHHTDHVHVALSSLAAQRTAEAQARRMGLHVGEESDRDVHPVHVHGSYHYKDFPHSHLREAADISGDPHAMAAFYRWVASTFGGSR